MIESGGITSTARTQPADEPEVSETTEGILDLLSAAPSGVYAVDVNQTIVFWNRSAEQILGHKASQVIGRRYGTCSSPRFRNHGIVANASSYSIQFGEPNPEVLSYW